MVRIIAVPYDSGRRGERMGAGPLRLLDAGVAARIQDAGHDVDVAIAEITPGQWPGEVSAAFDLAGRVAALVRAAIGDGAFPLILSGNCGPAALGCAAGVRGIRQVFWFDAHADFNTPDTTVSGFLDGMALATLTGRCWREMAGRLDGFTPVPENAVTLVGARDIDPLEAAALAASQITPLRADAGGAAIPIPVEEDGAATSYVHLDLDVLDPSEGAINSYSIAGGLSVAEVRAALADIRSRTRIAAASATAFDPACDRSGRALASALELCVALVPASRG